VSDLLASAIPYIPPILAAAILCDPAIPTDPVIERLPAAVLFADISGFTPLTEALAQSGPEGPEELTRLLNLYFSRMIALIEAEGGATVKFSGMPSPSSSQRRPSPWATPPAGPSRPPTRCRRRWTNSPRSRPASDPSPWV
jgi:hypothetical protein